MAELVTDCSSALSPQSQRFPDIIATLQGSKLQALAKKTAQAFEHEPVLASDIADGPSSLNRLTGKFKSNLLAQLSPEFGFAPNWIGNMTSRQLLSCFPDLVNALKQFKPRVEAAQKQAELERANKEAEARKPINVLGNAYVAYIFLRRCHEVREGYLTIYISDPELERARQAVQRIERTLKPQLDAGTDLNWMWNKSNEFANQRRIGRDACQSTYASLVKQYKAIAPEENTLEKDF